MTAAKLITRRRPVVVPRRHSASWAFTLVELLVVIGIIALLVGILLPALGRAQQMAKQTACLSNLRTMGQGLQMYLNENHNYYPGHCHKNSVGITYAIWPVRLRHYLNGNQMVFWCPAQLEVYQWPVTPGATTVSEPATNEDGQFGYNTGEQLLDVFKVQFSYGYNDWGCGNLQPASSNDSQRGCGGDISWYSNGPIHEVNAARLRNSSEMIIITDKYSNGSWNFNIDPTDPTQCPAQIHTTGSNALYADGHAEWNLEQSLVAFDVKTKSLFAKGSTQWNQVAPQWNSDNRP